MTATTAPIHEMSDAELHAMARKVGRQIINSQYGSADCDVLVVEKTAITDEMNRRWEARQI